MALSVVDLYSRILPKTNCKDCGFPTCIAFAGMVVSEKLPVKNCPHIAPDILPGVEEELRQQYVEGRWVKKDMAEEALDHARSHLPKIVFEEAARRTGGEFKTAGGEETIILPYFNGKAVISRRRVLDENGVELTRNEQTFIYIHLAGDGRRRPSGIMKSFKEFPNTVSKVKSMADQVETPLKKAFSGRMDLLEAACGLAGGRNIKPEYESPDLAFAFSVFPKVRVVLLFWDREEDFEAEVRLLFDDTVIEYLDIESIMFLSEHLCSRLIRHSTG